MSGKETYKALIRHPQVTFKTRESSELTFTGVCAWVIRTQQFNFEDLKTIFP